jgi:hypothetical protein
VSAQYGMKHCETLSPGERGEGAFGVVPMPTADGSRLLYPPPDWTQHFIAEGKALPVPGVVFVDEINRAAPAIQPPLLGLLNELRIGGAYLGPRVRICGAANPADSAPGVYELDPAEANRMGHFDWPAPNVQDWTTWALGGCNGGDGEVLDADAEEKRVMGEWHEAFAVVIGRVAAFLRAYPSQLFAEPKEGDPQRSRSWPSPRTWELATRAMAGCIVHAADEQTSDEVLTAFVGQAAASQYAAWLSKAKLPDPVAVLDGKVKWTHDPDRLDRTVAVLASCAALVTPRDAPKRDDRTARLWPMIGDVAKSTPDVVESAAAALSQSGLGSSKEAVPVLAKLLPILKSGRNG